RVRRAHRPRSCLGARARPRLRSCRRDLGGQCGRHRRPHRAAEQRRTRGDRAHGARRGEGRDRGRAALPGTFRPRDGDPARDGPVRATGAERPAPRPEDSTDRAASEAPSRTGREEGNMTETRRRTGGRAGRQAARMHAHVERVPFLTRTLATLEENAERILSEVGIEFHDAPDALERFAGAGADVQGERVRFPHGLCRSLVQATAPSQFTQVARNRTNDVVFGGQGTIFAPAYGSPFVRDLDGGRRYGTIEDFRNFVKLAYASPWLHHSGGTVCEPVDVPVNKRHFDMVYAHLRYSDKPFMGSVTRPERARDTVDMARVVFGADFVEQNTVLFSLINANSPLVWDASMLGAARAYAEANQAVMMTPFILAGAM